MTRHPTRRFLPGLLVALLAATLGTARAATDDGARRAAAPTRRAASARKAPGKAAHAATRPALFYERTWGIDIVGIHPVASGLMLRFDYRVVDPDKAAVLTDHQARPFLIDEASRTALAVPAMENVGELRQIAPLEPERTYFMIFGNPGRLVKPGSRVTIMAGNFRAEGLVVR
jgi:hypothetical protein